MRRTRFVRCVAHDVIDEVKIMNGNVLQGKWKQITGGAKKRWGSLTGSRLNAMRGDRDRLLGLIQEKYGQAREKAGRTVGRITGR